MKVLASARRVAEGRRSDVAAEHPREVRLVVEPDGDSDVAGRLAIEKAAPGDLDALPLEVGMGRDAEGRCEAADEMRGVGAEQAGGSVQRRRRGQIGVEERPHLLGQIACRRALRWPARLCAQVLTNPLHDECKAHLGFEGIVAVNGEMVDRRQARPQHLVTDRGTVDGMTHVLLADHARRDVEDSLAIPGVLRRPAVVRDVRREHRDEWRVGALLVTVEVVADRSFVDDEQRPIVVHVSGIGVLDEASMEHFGDPGHRRLPRPHRLSRRCDHAKIVQDAVVRRAYRPRGMDDLIALVAFSFVNSVTPGPNNVLLWSSGVEFGFRRTLPHVAGTAVGLAALAIAVAVGLGALITAVPGAELTLQLVGSVYLLHIAFMIAVSGEPAGTATIAQPLDVRRAVAFQAINPKAWVFSVAAIGTFRPEDLPIVAGSAVVAIVMLMVVCLTAAAWAAGGHALHRLVSGRRAHRAMSVTLALLLAGSVVYIWV
jgi:threonine/homoserine/homoserine lactone efflux protein